MRFGKTLRQSIHEPWKEQYMDYAKLKSMLREDVKEEDDRPWTESDEYLFTDEMLNTQLAKVAQFKKEQVTQLTARADEIWEVLRDAAPSSAVEDGDNDDENGQQNQQEQQQKQEQQQPQKLLRGEITLERLRSLREQMDEIYEDIMKLKKYSSLNYTGFLKIAKKHDRRRGDAYNLRPMMRLKLSECKLTSEEDYSPLLSRLDRMYRIIYEYTDTDHDHDSVQQPPDLEQKEEMQNGERYTAHKFWVHPDNLLEVRAYIVRRVPPLHYTDQQTAKGETGAGANDDDQSITSLYLDNEKFDLYTRKVDRQLNSSSIRLRWEGRLSNKPTIKLEQKIIHENGISEEKRLVIKDKYIKPFLEGKYSMEKSIEKMERQAVPADRIAEFKTKVHEMQQLITSNKLEPVVRANHTRAAYQRPGDDRVRIMIDSNLAFTREDTLDKERPCRFPAYWHRVDIDSNNVAYPFATLNQSEVSCFPFSVLEIKLKEDSKRKRPAWIEDLMTSHLVHPASRFSKFAHGVSSLFEDHVNNLPFWLSDLDTDIRKDPQKKFVQEAHRKARDAQEDQVVGSYLGKTPGSHKNASPFSKSILSERARLESDASGLAQPSFRGRNDAPNEEEDEIDDEDEDFESSNKPKSYGAIPPTISHRAMALWRRDGRKTHSSSSPPLPEGVVAPTSWLKNRGDLKIEGKVWLANERTFLKWQHICVLLGSLAVALYSAGERGSKAAELFGVAYIVIAVFAGCWGMGVTRRRRDMIRERSGKDFDDCVGPMVVAGALALALVVNFGFAYTAAKERYKQPKSWPPANASPLNMNLDINMGEL